MKKLMALTVLLLACSVMLLAQKTKQIKGKVFDENSGEPLEGATVTIVGVKGATQTDKSGAFTTRIPEDGKKYSLQVSYIGYANKTVAATNSDLVIRLEKSKETAGDEVVVIGYQSVKRKDLLASVASVGGKDLKDVPINSVAEALNGRMPGVTATAAEGSPDADVRIRVRGGMSITGDNSPLYIVDGVQVENGLNTVVIQDIQSIDVLKDAAATAIYGARGANGVIIITTKSGKLQSKPQVTFNSFVGVRSLAKKLGVLSPYEYILYNYERSKASAADSTSFSNFFGSTWDTLQNYKNIPVIDWQDEIMGRTGVAQTYNIGLSGGNKKTTYNLSYTHTNDKAIVLNSDYKRHQINAKADHKITSKLKVGTNIRFTNLEVLGAGVSDDRGTSYSRLRNAVKYRPFLLPGQDVDDNDPAADPNPGNGLSLVNPVQLANAELRRKTTNQINLSANITYNITKNLTFKSVIGYDRRNLVDRQFSDSLTPFATIQGGRKPIVNLDTTNATIITNTNTLTYSIKNYKKAHDIDFLIGQETYDLRTDLYRNQFRDYPTFTKPEEAFDNTSLATPFAGFPQTIKTRYTSLSFFGRISYSYKKRYLASFNLRADGSSKFATDKRWGYFPSGSFAWRVSNENFMENVKFVRDLKFRAGFGAVGNNRIDDYLYLTTFRNDVLYYGLNNQLTPGYTSSSLVNTNLRWESLLNQNFGLDASFLNGWLDLTVDYYINDSKDLLLQVPVAPTFGYNTQFQNIGKTQNKGFEVSLNFGIIRNTKKNLFWNASLNMSFNNNSIQQLGINQTQFFPAASWGVSGQPTDYIVKIGQPVGSMWGLVNDGFYTVNDFNYNTTTGQYTLKPGIANATPIIGAANVQPGAIKFKDLNNDGSVDLANDRTIIGNPTPKFTGGFSQNITYKNWDASMFFNFSFGNDIYNANKIEFTNGYVNRSNMIDIMQNRWRTINENGNRLQWVSNNLVYGVAPEILAAANANATIWQPIVTSGAFIPHSWAIEDGSFIRLNNLTIGYSLSPKSLVKLKISKMRFYAAGNNLFVITKYTGYDPEVSVRRSPLTPGLDHSAYPRSRSFVFGVNVTF